LDKLWIAPGQATPPPCRWLVAPPHFVMTSPRGVGRDLAIDALFAVRFMAVSIADRVGIGVAAPDGV